MANGLNAQQQTQLQGILQSQFGFGSSNARTFVSGGNQSVLGGLSNQSNLGGYSNTGNGINNMVNGVGNVVTTAVKGASNMAVSTLYDQLGNASNRISSSTIESILGSVVNGVSDIARFRIDGLLADVLNGASAAGSKLLKDLAETQAKLIETTNKSGAFVGELGSNMREELSDALVATTQLGMTVDDFLKSTETLLTSSGRMALYSKEAIESGVKASIAYTKSSTTLLENNEAFRNVGYGLQDAAKAITEAGHKTLELGLNAKVLTDTLVKNIGKLNKGWLKMKVTP